MNRDSDDEQLETLKGLWKNYGRPVLLGVVITLVSIFGYKAWQKSSYESLVAASQLYQDLLDIESSLHESNMSEENEATVNHVVDTLKKDHENSRYAAFACLFLAQKEVIAENLNKAVSSFEWILAQKPDSSIEAVTRIRLARVLLSLSDDNAQKALDVLSHLKADKMFFISSIDAVRGDAYIALGKRDEARMAYESALKAAHSEGLTRPLLQIKLDDLALLSQED